MKWKTFIGIIISVLFLYFAFRKVNIQELKLAFKNANYAYLIIVFFLALLSLWVRSLRWRYLLQPIKEIGLKSLFSATAIGFMANNLIPARLGEFVRAYVIGEKEHISKSSSFATIVVERIFDGATVLLFLVIIFIFYSYSSPGWLRNAAIISLILYMVTLLFLILLRVRTELILNISEYILRPFPQRIKLLFTRTLHSFVDGLRILHKPKNIIASALLSLLVWLPNVMIIYCLLVSFGLKLPIYASFLLLVIIGIGIMIPSAPGFVGTIQYCCVAGLALFSVSKSQALSFSIVYHVGIFIPVTAIGLFCLLIEGLSIAKIRKIIELEK